MIPRRNIDQSSSHPVARGGDTGAPSQRFTPEEIGKLHGYLAAHRDEWVELEEKVKKNATLTEEEMSKYRTLSGVIRALEEQLAVKEGRTGKEQPEEKPSAPLAVEKRKTKWEELIDKRDKEVDQFLDQLKKAVRKYVRTYWDKQREQERVEKNIELYRQNAKKAKSSASRIAALESAESPVKRLMKEKYESFFPGGREIKGRIRALDAEITRTPQPKGIRGANRLRTLQQRELDDEIPSDEKVESIEELFKAAK